MSHHSFDFAIIGSGAAGFHLAIQLAENSFFNDYKILILEKEKKNTNDRTWSFWELGETRWDEIAEKKWSQSKFCGESSCFDISLEPYLYKTIRSSRFYGYSKSIIEKVGNFTLLHEEVLKVEGNLVKTNNHEYTAKHIFDSRIPEAFHTESESYQSLLQHFLGWFIQTDEPTFDPNQLTMMDYRLQWKKDTSFTYVLPFSATEALVEFTLFNTELLEDAQYEEKLKSYIETYVTSKDYTIIEVEKGLIPMSNYPFSKHHSPTITKIGTAGGWVKPSSGYSFKNAERYAQMLVKNLRNGRPPAKGIATNRFRHYDSIFLRVLKERNDLGAEIFQTLYAKHPAKRLFRFLDEESSISEDLKIMFSLNKPIFQKALLKSFF